MISIKMEKTVNFLSKITAPVLNVKKNDIFYLPFIHYV